MCLRRKNVKRSARTSNLPFPHSFFRMYVLSFGATNRLEPHAARNVNIAASGTRTQRAYLVSKLSLGSWLETLLVIP